MNARIQDIYPLAPGQGGILFHAIGGGSPGDYVIQIRIDLHGDLDPERERAAWLALTERHDALRTAFVWKGQAKPLQVVGRQAVPNVEVTDLRSFSESEQMAYLTNWMQQDRDAGFDLTRAPLLRVNRFRLGEDHHRLVVTFHHIILDGWSIPVMLREWVALLSGQTLPPALPFKDYIAWCHAQDGNAAKAFWRSELKDSPAPSVAALPAPEAPPASRRGDLTLNLSAAQVQPLLAAARNCGVTLANVVQGAWALFLARSTDVQDVAYGLARAGRPAALKGSETRVGMFLTTLPMRARLTPDQPLAGWLMALQNSQIAQSPHEHLPLSDILATSGQRGAALMQTAVVFENYPTDPALLGQIPDLRIKAVDVLEQTGMALTLYAMQRDGLDLRLLFDAGAISVGAARQALDDVTEILTIFATHPETPLRDITIRSRAHVQAETPVLDHAPTGAALPALVKIWQDVLEIAPPSADQNFFDLGGHSLLVISLQDRIRRDLGLEVEIPDLFRFATLGAQSNHLARMLQGAASSDSIQTRAEAAGKARATGAGRLRLRRTQSMNNDRTEDA